MAHAIEWLNMPGYKGETWPVVTGCSYTASPGCKNCYAARLAGTRLRHLPRYEGLADTAGRWTGTVRMNRDVLDQPLRWKKPRIVFVASMGDLFHKQVSTAFMDQVFLFVRQARRHLFIALTKRPERAACYWERRTMPANLWLGVSVSNQADVNCWVPTLLQIPAAKRIISYEPALGAIDLVGVGAFARMVHPGAGIEHWGNVDWVLAGGESGPNARPAHSDWFCDVRDRCMAAGVPFLFKGFQQGKGRKLDGQTWDQYPAAVCRAGD